jgi:hypothetical protein
VVRRFGPNPLVAGLQVTNEGNITFSADSSDGGYEGAREALVQGVIAAKDEARRPRSRPAPHRLQLPPATRPGHRPRPAPPARDPPPRRGPRPGV